MKLKKAFILPIVILFLVSIHTTNVIGDTSFTMTQNASDPSGSVYYYLWNSSDGQNHNVVISFPTLNNLNSVVLISLEYQGPNTGGLFFIGDDFITTSTAYPLNNVYIVRLSIMFSGVDYYSNGILHSINGTFTVNDLGTVAYIKQQAVLQNLTPPIIAIMFGLPTVIVLFIIWVTHKTWKNS